MQSTQVDFVPFQRRIHSLPEGGRRDPPAHPWTPSRTAHPLWFVIPVGVGAAAVNRHGSNTVALAVTLGMYLAGAVSRAAIRG